MGPRDGFAVRAARRRAIGHDEMAAGDQRLLVGRGHDLAGAEGGKDRAQADDAPGRHDDEVDVVARRELGERVVARGPLRARRQVLAVKGMRVGDRHDRRPEPARLLRERRSIATGRQRDHAEELRVRGDDLDRLGPDRTRGAEERDAARLRRGRRRHTAW